MNGSGDELRYFADPMCSWCWGFAPVIRELADQLPGDLTLRVISGGLRAGNSRDLDESTRAQILHHWQQVQSATGQPFAFEGALPVSFVYDTEPACRAVSWVARHTPERSLDVLNALQAAFYRDGRDVTHVSVVQDVLQELELAELAQGLATKAAIQAAEQDFEETRAHGISGFPSLLLHRAASARNRIVSIGYQPLDDVMASLQRTLQRDS